jgi:hypothetical protein
MVKNRNIILDIPKGDAVATFHFIIGHDGLAVRSHRFSSYPFPVHVLCSDENYIINNDHIKKLHCFKY